MLYKCTYTYTKCCINVPIPIQNAVDMYLPKKQPGKKERRQGKKQRYVIFVSVIFTICYFALICLLHENSIILPHHLFLSNYTIL